MDVCFASVAGTDEILSESLEQLALNNRKRCERIYHNIHSKSASLFDADIKYVSGGQI